MHSQERYTFQQLIFDHIWPRRELLTSNSNQVPVNLLSRVHFGHFAAVNS